MVIDSSAFIAFLRNEPAAASIGHLIEVADSRLVSAFTVFETRVVLLRISTPRVMLDFERLLRDADIAVASFDQEQIEVASEAYQRFGKGRGHPAQLNMGDCAAYALATSRGLPLLYIGNDFARTDIKSAL